MEPKEMMSVLEVKVVLDRILDHHIEFKAMFKATDEKLDAMLERVNLEEKSRLTHVQAIKDELHSRINMILFSILGGAGLFISGVIMWMLDKRT